MKRSVKVFTQVALSFIYSKTVCTLNRNIFLTAVRCSGIFLLDLTEKKLAVIATGSIVYYSNHMLNLKLSDDPIAGKTTRDSRQVSWCSDVIC